MKERTKERIYGTFLGISFLVALPIACYSMVHSTDNDSELVRKVVAFFQSDDKEKENGNVANNINEFAIEDEYVASGNEALAEDNAQEQDNNLDNDQNADQMIETDLAENDSEETGSEELELSEEDKEPEFCEVGLDYFADAFFVGDSRTLGIMEYGGLDDAVFFANSGMSVIKLYDTKLKVNGLGKVSYEEALHAKSYGKVYIMLGMNEMGYDYDYIIGKYQAIIDEIKEVQPDALIYVCANLHLTKDAQGDILNNPDLDMLNERISEFADNKTIFYLDINPYYDDGEGNLNPDYSTDGIHIYAKYYQEWVNWLCTKAII